MAVIETTRQIAAPSERVFELIAHIENYKKAVPDIVNVEYLSETKRGVGTRFAETRQMGKRSATVELEVTEYESPNRIRIVSDTNGTVWDTLFTVEPAGENSVMKMQMESRPHKFMAKIITPLIGGFVRKAVEKDMDMVKAYAENH